MTLTDRENNDIVETTSFGSSGSGGGGDDVASMLDKLTLPPHEIGAALRDVLLQARDQGRLTCGVYECTQLLQGDASEVMLCILPQDACCDVTLHMHYTLLEAFCWENGIRVIKVDDVDKLSGALQRTSDVTASEKSTSSQRLVTQPRDYSCVIVEYPHDETSAADADVLTFYKMTCDVHPQPVVTLPG